MNKQVKTMLQLCGSALVTTLLLLAPTPCLAEQGYVIKKRDGNEILVSNFAVEGVIIEYYKPNGKSGYIAKDLVEDILLLKDIATYTPPSRQDLRKSVPKGGN